MKKYARKAVSSKRQQNCQSWTTMTRSDSETFYLNHNRGAKADMLIEDQQMQFDPHRVARVYHQITEPSDVVDLGCGVLGQVSENANMSAICDPRRYSPNLSSWRGIDAPRKLENKYVRSANIANTGLPNSSADVVVLNRVLNARPKRDILLEAFRILRQGGKVIGTMPLASCGRYRGNKDKAVRKEAEKTVKALFRSAGAYRVKFHYTWDRKNRDVFFVAVK